MKRTATVTVSRWVTHKQTGKVCMTLRQTYVASNRGYSQRLERSKKYLTHDEKDGPSSFTVHSEVLSDAWRSPSG